MSEREFYISIIPDVAELIENLKGLPKEDQEKIKEKMISMCKDIPAAYKFTKKLWIYIDICLKEGAA